MNRVAIYTIAGLFVLSLVVAAFPEPAAAQSGRTGSRAGGRAGGRIYNPKRLRTRADNPLRGRILRDPRKAPSTPRQPARRRALIPNPEPQLKGGSGYTKRGRYYYQDPKPIRAGGNTKRRIERVKIPHPNKKLR